VQRGHHGLDVVGGPAKRGALGLYKTALELQMMRMLKNTFDPRNIMNPGKVLPDDVPH